MAGQGSHGKICYRNGGQWLAGKAMDCFAPLGPAVVTADEVGDPHNLNISCRVNNEIKQVRIIITIQGFQPFLTLTELQHQ